MKKQRVKVIDLGAMGARCEEVSGLLKALAHPARLMIMGHLIAGEKSVTELQKLCDISQSQLSQFLSRMRLENLVSAERRGRFLYYRAADDRMAKLVHAIQAIYCSHD